MSPGAQGSSWKMFPVFPLEKTQQRLQRKIPQTVTFWITPSDGRLPRTALWPNGLKALWQICM